jgi:monoamine oxidase
VIGFCDHPSAVMPRASTIMSPSIATHRVAIIGTGIAGSAAAYFAHQAFASSVSLVVFEQSEQIGGRIQHRSFSGSVVETGATLMHSSNAYLSGFIDELCVKAGCSSRSRRGLVIYVWHLGRRSLPLQRSSLSADNHREDDPPLRSNASSYSQHGQISS